MNQPIDEMMTQYKRQFNIEFAGLKEFNFKNTVKYLQEEKKYELILSECGIPTI